MNAEIITIYCRNDSLFFLFLANHDARETVFKTYGYKVRFFKNFHAVIDLTIDGRNVRIITSREPMSHCDVCIVGSSIASADFNAEVKRRASLCKEQYLEAPIIVFGDASFKNYPPRLKRLELAGQKVFNRKMCDELVRDIGAVKYVEYSRKSGRGLKILIDEVVFVYFCKLKDEEDRERMKKLADEIQHERTKRNLFIFQKFLDVLHYI